MRWHRTWQLFNEIGVLCCKSRLLQNLFTVAVLQLIVQHTYFTVTMRRAAVPY